MAATVKVTTDASSSPQPPQDIVAQRPISMLDFRKRYRKILLAFGISEVILGGFLIFLTTATLTIAKGPNYYFGVSVYCFFGDFFTYIGIGIWSGTCGLLAGVLGIVIKIKQFASLYIANMTVAIITAHFSCVGVVLSGLAARFSVCATEMRELHIAIACLCFIMMIINMAHAVVCCNRTCCEEGYLIPQQMSHSLQQNMECSETPVRDYQHLITSDVQKSEQPDPVAMIFRKKGDEMHHGPANQNTEESGKMVKPSTNLRQIQLESRVDRSEQLLKLEKSSGTNETGS